jgi:hypothetical protein
MVDWSDRPEARSSPRFITRDRLLMPAGPELRIVPGGFLLPDLAVTLPGRRSEGLSDTGRAVFRPAARHASQAIANSHNHTAGGFAPRRAFGG